MHGSLQSRTLRECLAATKIGTTSASFVFHHGNAWLDEQTQTLHTDSVAYETFPSSFAVRVKSSCLLRTLGSGQLLQHDLGMQGVFAPYVMPCSCSCWATLDLMHVLGQMICRCG